MTRRSRASLSLSTTTRRTSTVSAPATAQVAWRDRDRVGSVTGVTEQVGHEPARRGQGVGDGLARFVVVLEVERQVGDGQALDDVVVDLERVTLAESESLELLAGRGRLVLVGDVLHRALELHHVATFVPDGAAARLHPPFVTIRRAHAVLEHIRRSGLEAPSHELLGKDALFGAKKLDVPVVGRHRRRLAETEDVKHLVGPRDVAIGDVPLPAPQPGNALGLGQEPFVLEERLGDSPAFGVVAGDLGEPAKATVLVVQGGDDDAGPELGTVLTEPPALGFDPAVLLG